MKPIAQRVRSGALAALAAAALGQTAGAEHAYVGAKKCKACHLKEFNSWSETKMSKVFELLKPGVAAAAKTKAKLDPNEGLHEGCELPPMPHDRLRQARRLRRLRDHSRSGRRAVRDVPRTGGHVHCRRST